MEVTRATLSEIVQEENCQVVVGKFGVVTTNYLTMGADGLTASEGDAFWVSFPTEKSSKLEKLVWCLLLSSFSSPAVKRVNASAEATSAGEVPVIGVTGW